MIHVEQREPTVNAIAADPLCITLLVLVSEPIRYLPLRARVTCYMALLWEYYGIIEHLSLWVDGLCASII
jgi:hypothetical protein